ncbi:ABC-type antimicrobial peptide transport system, permease component [Salinarchaeum sp. Harcht-Bsk1]|uniref:ABC transporter permease n=1 Tax=Salinarchaeum sp. Harcht-Bsk1 TaxID=1333523 RepID=UPI0003423F36|nr:ABC transporter permease [Salinarchaeum sp. Harcht-Bsk1]AGN00150.1 ABC-type antimicrobial peptide transport system, permease component [Salinarchaeum sp. Harcht-Bsk1]
MKFFESIRIGWRSITGHKLRSTLTTLGVIIGIASVIVFMMLGGAFQEDVLGDVDVNDEPVMQVSTQTSPDAGTGIINLDAPIYTERDVEQLRAIDGVEYVAPTGDLDASQVTFSGDSITGAVGVTATSPERFQYDGFDSLEEGETFAGPGEAVISDGLTEEFEENVTVGDEIQIALDDGRRINLTVAGIVESNVGAGGGGNNVWTSLEHYQTSVDGPDGNQVTAFGGLEIRASSQDELDSVQAEVTQYLKQDSDAQELKQSDHRIVVQTIDDMIDQFTGILDQITIFIGGIAAISLVVGSIGIANIMIVSVTERTSEIGVMKAVGARSRDVLQLFLLESIILGAIGAVFGVLTGVGLGYLIVNFIGWPVVYPLNWIGIAVAVGIGVGVVSGLYPAWRAARVDPIEALRRE